MLSVVVPVRNEEENIVGLVRGLHAVAEHIPIDEFVFVDDGSTDETRQVLKSIRREFTCIRIVSHDRAAGQSAALWTGVRVASNGLVATLDGDGQNDPAEIARLYECYMVHADKKGPLMVSGQRVNRHDSFIRRLSSQVANSVRSSMLKDHTRDTGCGLKLFRRTDYLQLPYFNHMHRFLPALMLRQGVKVMHVDVTHKPRLRGQSKYGMWDRLWVGIADLFGVLWLQRRARSSLTILEE